MGLLFVFIYIISLFNIPISDGDMFFHIKVGEYIVKNGFPQMDPFSMHTITYTPHEWLADVFFYFIYSKFGFLGLFVLQYIVLLVLILILYKININLSNGSKYLSVSFAIFTVVLFCAFSITIRPQIFTYMIIAIEIFCLEKYSQTEERKYLYYLPVLTLVLANVHAGVYPLFFVIALPYLAESLIYVRIGRLICGSSEKAGGRLKKVFPLLIFLILAFLIGSINPYGFKKLFYFVIIFNSNITHYISEWSGIYFGNAVGVLLFSVFIAVVLLFMLSKKDIQLRHMLLLCGTAYMALASIRYYTYFAIAAGIVANIYVSQLLAAGDKKAIESRIVRIINGRQFKLVFAAAIIVTISIKTIYHQWVITDFSEYPKKAVEYLKSREDLNKIKLYNEYNVGGYLIFEGVKVFIDPRADLYSEK